MRAFEQRKGRVRPQMDEIRVTCGHLLSNLTRNCRSKFPLSACRRKTRAIADRGDELGQPSCATPAAAALRNSFSHCAESRSSRRNCLTFVQAAFVRSILDSAYSATSRAFSILYLDDSRRAAEPAGSCAHALVVHKRSSFLRDLRDSACLTTFADFSRLDLARVDQLAVVEQPGAVHLHGHLQIVRGDRAPRRRARGRFRPGRRRPCRRSSDRDCRSARRPGSERG